ncbi:MAG: glycosyltransferase family 9 protein [Capsulimonadaceae bacterium]|nr:glycosyltransferase family 9 protein [Capsulimonadaceae bacterium]
MAEIRRILIATKYRFIGDTLLSVPAIRATAMLWPEARITLLTGSKALEIVQNCPFVHDAVEFDPYRPSDQGVVPFVTTSRSLRQRNFDLALVLNRSFHSALISTVGGARLRAGWSGFAHRDFLLHASCPYNTDDSEIDSYLDVVACAYRAFGDGALPDKFDRHLEVWLTDEERAGVPDMFKRPGLFVGIQPGATHAYKRWPAHRFAALADFLCGMSGEIKLVVIGGPDECEIADQMLAHCADQTRARLINLTGTLPLRGTLAVLEKLSYFIANDTAIRHAAMSLGVPSLGLFGPTSALKWGNACPPLHCVLEAPAGNLEDLGIDSVVDAVRAAIESREQFALSPLSSRRAQSNGHASPAVAVAASETSRRVASPDFRAIMVTTKYRYLGDTLLTGPALKAIRKQWPNAHVTLLTGPNAADLMRNCPYVNSIIPFNPESRENRGLNLYVHLVPELRRRGIDAAIVYHTSAHAALTPWLARVPYRIGWAGFERRDRLFSDTLPYDPERNELECNLDMVRHIAPGLEADNSVELWLSAEELEDVPDSIRVDDRIIGLQPGATNDGKRWPAPYYAELAQLLLDRGLAGRIAVIGGPDELIAGEEMLSACSNIVRERTINLVGKTRLRQTLAVLSRLALFVGNDTAIRHTTVALDVPSVGLFGPTNNRKWGNHCSPRQEIMISPTGVMQDIHPSAVIELIEAQAPAAASRPLTWAK